MDRSESSTACCATYVCVNVLVLPSFDLLSSLAVLLWDLVIGLWEEVSSCFALNRLVLSVVESINFDMSSLGSSCACRNSSDVSCIRGVAIFPLYWLDDRIIKVDY